MLGSADEVAEERVGDGELVFIRGTRTSKSVSLVLRGANEFLLDEMDRSLHDTLCVVQKVLESRSLVAGGGAVEAALSVYLDGFATTLGSKEQLAIKEFADALLVIPKTLAVNAAKDATELVAKLCAFHHTAQTVGAVGGAGDIGHGGEGATESDSAKAEFRFMGLDLVKGKVSEHTHRRVCRGAHVTLRHGRLFGRLALFAFLTASPAPHPFAPPSHCRW